MFIKVFLLIILIFSMESWSQEDKSSIKKLTIDKKLLISDNIDKIFKENNIEVDWVFINKECTQNESNFQLNKCRIENALNYYNFQRDYEICKSISNNISNYSLDGSYKLYKNDTSSYNSVINEENAILSADGKNIIDNIVLTEYYKCMINRNWVDPNDWHHGKTISLYVLTESNYMNIN